MDTKPKNKPGNVWDAVADVFVARREERKPFAARCECYQDHNSSSGRCTMRSSAGIDDPTATKPGDAVYCVQCRSTCRKDVVAARAKRDARTDADIANDPRA